MEGNKLDSGDIMFKEYFPISINTKITSVLAWMKERIPNLFRKTLDILEQNPKYFLEKQSTKHENILRCFPRKPEDGKINWSDDIENILRLINASNKPYDGAF